VSIPPILESLRPRGAVFLGSADAPQGIRPLRPYATVTPTGQPEFAWESPVAGPFEVEVFDPEFRRVANSGPIDTSSWTPSTSLPRGVILTWRVTARSTGLTGPRAPDPEARFVVLDEAAAAAWNAKSGRDGPVARGIDALRLGMRQEALQLWSTDPRTAELRKSIDW
jgi:hypothetical protein